jgi:predicted negative regulator of RcsB-dependent stress response
MDRQHRHDLKHDKFVDEIGVLTDRARANQRLLIAIGLGAILLAAAIYGFLYYRGNKEDKAQLALASAIETIEAQVGEDQAQQQQNPLQTGPKFKTAEERNTAAEKQFRDVQTKFGGTDAADLAGLYLARLAVGKGDVTNARKGLEQFIDEHGDHPLLGGSARYSLYQLRIENGEAAQVANEIELELKKPETDLPGDALLVLQAQAYDVQGNAAKSREAYRRIMNEFPESQYAVEAARRAGQA